MSEVITGVLRSTFGLISNKLREKLLYGGFTDLSTRYAYSYLQMGINRLNEYIELSESGNHSSSELSCTGASSIETKPVQQSVLVSAVDTVPLANAIEKLKIESNERFELAKESFKEAEEQASEEFHNAALSTEERIIASEIRVASGIFQHLDDLEFAVRKCLHYLQELNDMPAIKEIFSVHLKGGKKSDFMEPVIMIHCSLADFISKFTKQRIAVFDWPMISCGKRTKRLVHPLHYDRKSSPVLTKMEITPPWDIVVLEEDHFMCKYDACPSALTKKGDLVCVTRGRHGLQKLGKTTDEPQSCLSPLENNTEHPQPNSKVIDIAVDKNDTVYVVSGDENAGYMLSVYNADERKTRHCILEFLKGHIEVLRIAITMTNDIKIVICCDSDRVYLCDSKGKLVHSFDPCLTSHFLESVTVSSNHEIILTTTKTSDKTENVFYVYTEDGQLQRKVTFHPSEANDYYDSQDGSVFYNHGNIIGHVKNYSYDNFKILIESLSGETGEHQLSYLLCNVNFPESVYDFHLVSHTNGTLALVGDHHVIFLKKPN